MENTEVQYTKNRLFAKYGHNCKMPNDLGDIPKLIPGESWWCQFKRFMLKLRTVSEISAEGNKILRSQGAIANEKKKHLYGYRYMIHPFSDVTYSWKIFICGVFLLQFIMVPLDVAYFRIPNAIFCHTQSWRWLRMICDCLCMVDLCLHFFTGYYSHVQKEVILSPKKVCMHYLTTYFFFDLISSIPTHFDVLLNLNFDGKVSMILYFTSLLKLLRVHTFSAYITQFSENLGVPYPIHRIVMVIAATFLYIHIGACCVIFGEAYACGFLENTAHSKRNSNINYPSAVYIATIIAASAGYGKDPPSTFLGYICIIGAWLLSKAALAFLIVRLMQVVKATLSSNHKYVGMVCQLSEYMKHKGLPEHIQQKLLLYYNFRFQKSYFRENEILGTLSTHLRQEIVMHSTRRLVENVAFFKNIPLNLLVRIVSCLHSEIFLVNDVIVKANTPGNAMFFISSGTVAVYTAAGREICHLEDGAHFGEIALVTKPQVRVAAVVAVEICELYKLEHKEFIRAIYPYPDLLDKIQRIAADRMEKTALLDEHDKEEMRKKNNIK